MSGISGFPSSQKNDLGTGKTNSFSTVIPTDPFRNSLDTSRFLFRVDNSTVPRTAGAQTGLKDFGSGGGQAYWVHDPGTPAKRGDIIRCEDGSAMQIEIPIIDVSEDGDFFLLSIKPQDNVVIPMPEAGDTFYILRHTTQRVDSTGSQIVVAEPGPTQFVLDGLDVEVEEDTTTPANNKPLPTKIFDAGNLPINPATEETLLDVLVFTQSIDAKIFQDQQLSADSISVVLASDQTPVPTQSPVNTGGFYDEITDLDTTPQTFLAPANAIGFVIEALSDNSNNIRYKIGAAASATSGMRLEPGRSENFNAGPAANISVAAEGGTNQVISIQWILRA